MKFTKEILIQVNDNKINMVNFEIMLILLFSDLLLNIIREYLRDNTSATKIILMSATVEPSIFMRYLDSFEPSLMSISIEREFKLNIFYLDNLKPILRYTNDIIDYKIPSITREMYNLALKIIILHFRDSKKSVLVFLPGIYEIESMNAILISTKDLVNNCTITLLHSSLSIEEQKRSFAVGTKPKIILSTNIAESSVTIRRFFFCY